MTDNERLPADQGSVAQADLTITQRLKALADIPCQVCSGKRYEGILLEAWEQQQAAMAECPDCSGTGLLLPELTEPCPGEELHICQGGHLMRETVEGLRPFQKAHMRCGGTGYLCVSNPVEALITGLLRIGWTGIRIEPWEGQGDVGVLLSNSPSSNLAAGESRTWQEALVQAAEKALTRAADDA